LIIRMQLLSDVIFGNGMSIPGGEDISVLCDDSGFPYYKGGTFKGIFREALEQYLGWTMQEACEIEKEMERLLGKGGENTGARSDKLVFSDFQLSDYVKRQILKEVEKGREKPEDMILYSLTHQRTFTALSEEGIAAEGSLRSCRCVNKGLNLYSQVECRSGDEELIAEVLSSIKWIGTMRNRGFGKVKLTVVE
jgi:CRISPR/Cas system CSM-associated protein Csm3 (group 7 of RAMP superfamily)